jgi:hypothetical protein
MKNRIVMYMSLLLVFSGCKKDLNTVLTGVWDVDKIVYTGNGIPDETAGNQGTIEFKSDKTGIYTDQSAVANSFSWTPSSDNKSITLDFATFIRTYTVTVNTSGKQQWELSMVNSIYTKATWYLTKK